MNLFRVACFGLMILGWIWNRKQWGFRGFKQLINGEGLIFTGFISLLITYPSNQRLIEILLVVIVLLGQEFQDQHQKNYWLGSLFVTVGILGLLVPDIMF